MADSEAVDLLDYLATASLRAKLRDAELWLERALAEEERLLGLREKAWNVWSEAKDVSLKVDQIVHELKEELRSARCSQHRWLYRTINCVNFKPRQMAVSLYCEHCPATVDVPEAIWEETLKPMKPEERHTVIDNGEAC